MNWYKIASNYDQQNEESYFYHGGPNIDENILRTKKNNGMDAGGIFLTDNLDYAKQYSKPAIYKVPKSQLGDNLFDPRKPEHLERLKTGFEKMFESGLYDDLESAKNDYEYIVNNIDLLDWAEGSQWVEEIEAAGFDGAVLRERHGKTNLNENGGYEISGDPIYSVVSFKSEIPVSRLSKIKSWYKVAQQADFDYSQFEWLKKWEPNHQALEMSNDEESLKKLLSIYYPNSSIVDWQAVPLEGLIATWEQIKPYGFDFDINELSDIKKTIDTESHKNEKLEPHDLVSVTPEDLKNIDWEEVDRYTNTPEFQNWFSNSKVVTDSGKPEVLFRGDFRGDKINGKFKKNKLTSGGFYFTDSPDIASQYTGKRDPALEDELSQYENWFKFDPPKESGGRSPLNLEQIWYRLPQEIQKRIENMVYLAGVNPEENGQYFDFSGNNQLTSKEHIDWIVNRNRKPTNWLKIAQEIWLNSGELFDQEDKFLEFLQAAGLNPKYDAPNKGVPRITPVFLSLQNPLDTSNIPNEVVQQLRLVAKNDRNKNRKNNQWDKFINCKEFMQVLEEDLIKGTTYAWTTIPDKITQALQSMGYDGIKDLGGKYRGEDLNNHVVWIAFEPNQIKSAYINNGKFENPRDIKANNISWYRTAQPLTKESIKYQEMDKPIDERAPIFKSMLNEKLQAKLPVNTNVNQVMQILNSKDFGVNKAEIEWSGLLEWLQLEENQNRRIPKDDIIKFVSNPAYSIHEEHPHSTEKILEEELNWDDGVEIEQSSEDLQSYIDDNLKSEMEEVRNSYNLNDYENKEDYENSVREDTIRILTDNFYTYSQPIYKYKDSTFGYTIIYDKEDGVANLIDPDGNHIQNFNDSKFNGIGAFKSAKATAYRVATEKYGTYEKELSYDRYIMDGESEDYNELLFTLKNNDPNKDLDYNSNHFNNTNILAHVRYDTRKDENGNELLFIEEIQSDMNQSGRKEGFYKPEEKKKNKEYKEKINKDREDKEDKEDKFINGIFKSFVDENNLLQDHQDSHLYWSLFRSMFSSFKENYNYFKSLYGSFGGYEEIERNFQEFLVIYNKYNDLINKHYEYDKKAPENPLKETQAWIGLVVKKMLRLAAEKGINKIAWTTGEEQSERYDLTNHLDYVVLRHYVNKDTEEYGTYDLIGYKSGIKKVEKNGIKDIKEIDDYIGFEIRTRLLNSTPKKIEIFDQYELKGDDLKFNSDSGMTEFYDRIVPSVVNKIGKKYGTSSTITQIPTVIDKIYNINVFKSDDIDLRTYKAIGMAGYDLDKNKTYIENATDKLRSIFGNDFINVFYYDESGTKLLEEDAKRLQIALDELHKIEYKQQYSKVFSMEINENMKNEILNVGQYIYSKNTSWYKAASLEPWDMSRSEYHNYIFNGGEKIDLSYLDEISDPQTFYEMLDQGSLADGYYICCHYVFEVKNGESECIADLNAKYNYDTNNYEVNRRTNKLDKPKFYYHGTRSNVNNATDLKSGTGYGPLGPNEYEAIYITSDPQDAEMFANGKDKKVLEMTLSDNAKIATPREAKQIIRNINDETTPEQAILAAGFDGVGRQDERGDYSEIAVLNPNIIINSDVHRNEVENAAKEGRIGKGIQSYPDLTNNYASNEKWYKMAQEEINNNVQIPKIYKDTIDMLSAKAEQVGLRAYAVGGFVRDLLIGKNPKDLDIMVDVDNSKLYHNNIKPIYENAIKDPVGFVQAQITGAKKITDVNRFVIKQSDHRPEFFRINCTIDYIDNSTKKSTKVKDELFETSLNPSQLLAKQFDRTVPRGEAFGIFAVQTPVGEVELAYPRTEVYEAGSRKPTTTMGTIDEDANRRDFSCNAMFLDLKNFNLIDGSGHGLQDIKDKTIRITDPEAMDSIFKEDPLRVLRCVRQSAQLGFSIDPKILEYIKANPHIIAMKGTEISWDDETFEPKLSSERIAEETKKIMSLSNASSSMSLMNELGIINHVFLLPDNAEDWRLDQINPHHHENVWDHTITVMKQLDNFLNESNPNIAPDKRFELNMAAFLHDSGKLIPEAGFQNKKDETGNVTRRTFVGHPEQSTQITNDILTRLKYPTRTINNITNLVRLHDEALKLQDPKNKDYLLMKLIKDIGQEVYSLLSLSIADRRAHIEGSNDSGYLEEVLNSLPERYESLEVRTKAFISGNDIKSIMNYKDGKWIRILLDFIEDCQMKGQINSSEEAKLLVSKLSIVCNKIGKKPDNWISQILPYLLTVPNDEESIIRWLSTMSNKLKTEGNIPLIEKYITGNDIIDLSNEMAIPVSGPKFGEILADAFSEQMAGNFKDEQGIPDRTIALNWLVQRIEQEKLQVETPIIENEGEEMNLTSSNWYSSKYASKDTMFVFSERNQQYDTPTSIEEDDIDNFIDVCIDELGKYLSNVKYYINWERIYNNLNDKEFFSELKKDFELYPKEMYENYIFFRDENIREQVASILDAEIRTAQSENVNIGLIGSPDFDTSELDGVFGSDIVNEAKKLVLSYNSSLFSNIVKVNNENGNFLGVFKPEVNQNIVQNLKDMQIIDEDKAENILSGGGLTFSVNPDRVFSEKEGLKEQILKGLSEKMQINESDPNFEKLIQLNDKHLLTLLLGEVITHEAIHASGNPESGYPDEGAAESGEKDFLSFAINKINSERESNGIEPLEIGIQ